MQHFEEIPTMDAMMQSAVIDLICKDASLNPANKVVFHYFRILALSKSSQNICD